MNIPFFQHTFLLNRVHLYEEVNWDSLNALLMKWILFIAYDCLQKNEKISNKKKEILNWISNLAMFDKTME